MSEKQKRRFAATDLFTWKIAAEVAAGADGRVAYTLRQADLEESSYRTHIWSVSQGQSPVQLTRGEKGCSAPQWSPDGRHLAFISSRPEGKGEASGKPQVWLLPTAGGEAFALTKAPQGVRSFRWAPDGQSLFFVAEEPDQEATKARREREKKQKFDVTVEHADKRRRQIWRVDAREGAEAGLIFDGCFGLGSIAVAPVGEKLTYTTNYSGLWEDGARTDLWVLDLATGQATRLTQGTGGIWGHAFSPDGETVAFIGPHDADFTCSRSELFTIPVAGGAITNVTDKNPAFYGDVVDMEWLAPGEMAIIGVVGCYAHIYKLDVATGAVERLTPAEETVSFLTASADRRYLAYVTESNQHVTEVMLLDLRSGQPAAALTDLNPWLKTDIELGEQRVVSWQNEGMTIEGVLTLPPGHKDGDRHPLIVYVHGGPHARVPNTLRQSTSWQVLAAEGYAVLAPNYRGGMGYGHAHAVSNIRDLGGGDYRDIMAGVDHVIAMGVADGDKMGIMGGSYGGYMTNWAIGQTDRFKAAVSQFGIFNLVTDYSQSDLSSWDYLYLRSYWWDDPAIFAQCSPSTHVKKMTTPVLIIHGDADNNTYPANSKEMWQALRHLGRTVQYVHYPREGHGITEPNHKLDEYRRVLGWFEQYVLGGAPECVGTATSKEKGHTLTVTAVDLVASYSGRKPKGGFVELALRVAPGAENVKLDLSRVRLIHKQGEYTWEIGVAGVAAGMLLIPSGGTVEMGAPSAVTVVFDLPEKAPAGAWQLVTELFPPVIVSISK